MEERIRRADRLSTIGEMAAGLAHEIRNPLASLSGSAEVLRENLSGDDDTRRLLDVIGRETERLNRIMGEFLAFSRGRNVDFRKRDICLIIDEVVMLLKHDRSFREGSRIDSEHEGSCLLVNCDEEQLKQVFLNLGINALQAVGEGGSLRIRVSDGRKCGERGGAGWVDISFIDDGAGIGPEQIGKLFTPFYSTKEDGTGLGLAIAHRIVKEHRGMISVSSEAGRGAVFTVALPVAEGGGESDV